MEKMERKIKHYVKNFSGDARELNSVRSEEKWIFFPSWTGSSFFAQTSTYWEPAAMKKRNPPNPAKGCASELYDLQSNRSEKGGVVRAGEKVRLNHEKKLFCFSNRLFLAK